MSRASLVLLAIGLGAFGIAAANGHALELLWLPALLLGASWPRDAASTRGRCLRRARGD
jgi:hypothetical protein